MIGGVDETQHSYCVPGSPEAQALALGQQGKQITGASNSSEYQRGFAEYESARVENSSPFYSGSSNSPSDTSCFVTTAYDSDNKGKKTKKQSDDDCFVTTATYGNANHPMVQEFRGLRDYTLAKTRLGREFIAWYYENGPQMAAVLREKTCLKAPTRTILTPLALAARAFRKMNGQPLP